jgi:hypothetical protein
MAVIRSKYGGGRMWQKRSIFIRELSNHENRETEGTEGTEGEGTEDTETISHRVHGEQRDPISIFLWVSVSL